MLIYNTNSPIHHKFEELFSQMEKMGISMSTYSMRNFFTIEGTDVRIVDAENGRDIMDFPPMFEWRVAIDN